MTTSALAIAKSIARRLCCEAEWQGKACNWRDIETGEPLGCDLYGGCAGIAWYLAEWSAATGDAEAKRTAVGAMYSALGSCENVPFHARLGLYTGWSGVALAAAHVGLIGRREELIDDASRLADIIELASDDEKELDFLSGSAGAIVALLRLSEILGAPHLIGVASRIGEELVTLAEHDEHGLSWPTIASPQRRNLTGFSHGASGIAFALLELFATTRDVRFRETAAKAFDYERRWLDRAAGNWTDLREEAEEAGIRFGTSWCHGAPGIALARIDAKQYLTEQHLAADARIAVRTTTRALERAVSGKSFGLSLCHGLIGLAAVLFICTGQVSMIAPLSIETVNDPSLMLGLSGIGLYFLRTVTASPVEVLTFSKTVMQH